MVWYSHLFKNFPQFVVIHTAKVVSHSGKGGGVENFIRIFMQ